MRQPSIWLFSLAVALLATFVLQSDPASFGPFVDLGRFLARTAVVGVVALLAWHAVTVGRDWLGEVDHGRRATGVLVALGGLVVAGVLLGFFGYGNVLAGVVVALVGVTGAASVAAGD
ncbi:hypothetical protein C2R22_07890 [Salinigranum rubrum]|uniref:Uncharacterized protein n=1 Tax=Salinigranum rubrum TaxID=755307 RepID=A0A2I8VI72_9EURY|nr:hypothetical protein [Salinigranum rubrum]AUV81584.1 hypothetical protein C2R22_07890 [Salinigranum rubrum]